LSLVPGFGAQAGLVLPDLQSPRPIDAPGDGRPATRVPTRWSHWPRFIRQMVRNRSRDQIGAFEIIRSLGISFHKP